MGPSKLTVSSSALERGTAGKAMATETTPPNLHLETASETVACPFCREPILAGAIKCKHCHSSLISAQRTATEKSPGIAALLSLFLPGAGHFYAEDVKGGATLLVCYLFCIFLAFLFSEGVPIMVLIFILLAFSVWLYGCLDAMKTARAYNSR